MDNKQVVARFGSFTSSEIGKLLISGKKKGELFGKGALTYIDEKCAELITAERKQSVSGYALEWGINNEPKAMLHYQANYNHKAIYYGANKFKYFEHPEILMKDISFAGGSPDFETDFEAGELKCPLVSSNHVAALKGMKSKDHNKWLKEYDPIYYAQVQWNIECMNKEKGVWCSYDPRVQEMKHAMAVLHITKDNDLINDLKTRLHAALQIMSDFLNS